MTALISTTAAAQAKEAAAAAAKAAATEAAPGPSALPTITLDLNAVHTIGTLPFDVPIRFTGKVDTNINRLRLVVERLPKLPPKPKKGEPIPKYCPAKNLELVSTSEWMRLAGSKDTDYAVVVPPLEPNQYYCLTFEILRTLAEGEQTVISAAADRKIRAAFEKPENLNGLVETEAVALRATLKTDIRAAAPVAVEFKSGSLFDEASVSGPQLMTRLAPVTRSIVTGQLNAKDSVDNINDALLHGVRVFEGWLSRPTTVQFFRELRTFATREQNPDKTLIPYSKTIETILTWQPSDAMRLLNGDGSPNPPTIDWTGALYKTRLTAVKANETRLREARELVRAFINPPAGASQSSVSQDDLKALSAAIGETIGSIVSVAEELTLIDRWITMREQGIVAFVKFVEVEAVSSTSVFATSIAEFSTRHAQYVSVDLGLGYIPGFEEAFTFTGMNVYFRPVNKGAPLRGLQFRRRFAVMLGVTMSGDIEKTGERFHNLGTRSIVAGAGFRFIDSLRLVGGALFFKRDDPLPLVTKEEPAWTPFVALTIDWDAKSTWDNLFGRNQNN